MFIRVVLLIFFVCFGTAVCAQPSTTAALSERTNAISLRGLDRFNVRLTLDLDEASKSALPLTETELLKHISDRLKLYGIANAKPSADTFLNIYVKARIDLNGQNGNPYCGYRVETSLSEPVLIKRAGNQLASAETWRDRGTVRFFTAAVHFPTVVERIEADVDRQLEVFSSAITAEFKEPDLLPGARLPSVTEAEAVGVPIRKIRREDLAFQTLVRPANPDVAFSQPKDDGADRYMTQALAEATGKLAALVKTEWPGQKLQIVRGWLDDDGAEAPTTRHEARSVDITVTDYDSSKLGRLARLAATAGFAWVSFEDPSHVRATVRRSGALINGFTASELTAAAQAHEVESKYGAAGDVTQCSKFVRDFVQDLLHQTRPELQGQVKDQFDQLAASPSWKRLNFAQDKASVFAAAQVLANNGAIVVVAWKNPSPTPTDTGHIAIVVPGSLEESTTWGMKVPVIAQAGKKNPREMAAEADKSVFSSLKLSWGFGPDKAAGMELFEYIGSP
jgi:hypothetical protein